MLEHDAQRRHANDSRGLHVFLVALHQRGATHRARVLHPARQGDGQDQHPEGQAVVRIRKHRARHAVDEQRDQDRREGQHHVTHAHDERINGAAHKARQQAEANADDERQQHRRKTHRQRQPRAVEQR